VDERRVDDLARRLRDLINAIEGVWAAADNARAAVREFAAAKAAAPELPQ
jgi:hypothetical protein